jgi:hypothetical protein
MNSGLGTSSTTTQTSSTTSTTSSSTMDLMNTTTNPGLYDTTNPGLYELMLKIYTETQKPQTPAQIRAAGEVKRIEGEMKNKFTVLIIIGIISVLLTLFGCITFIVNPKNAKDVWVFIGPIITAGISGTVGFLTGEKQGTNKE